MFPYSLWGYATACCGGATPRLGPFGDAVGGGHTGECEDALAAPLTLSGGV